MHTDLTHGFMVYFERRCHMPFTLDPKHLHVGSHHRFWLILVAIAAFIIAAFWTQPIG